MFRVTAIRNNEEIVSWEILNGSKGQKRFREYNSTRLQTFRWPFFAYASYQQLIISPLYDKKHVAHLDLALEE